MMLWCNLTGRVLTERLILWCPRDPSDAKASNDSRHDPYRILTESVMSYSVGVREPENHEDGG